MKSVNAPGEKLCNSSGAEATSEIEANMSGNKCENENLDASKKQVHILRKSFDHHFLM